MNRTVTQTISLPKELARRARRVAREENRTISELFREALREYETRGTRSRIRRLGPKKVNWQQMQRDLLEISRAGRKVNLTEFLIRDRRSH